jgi:hypothetical protein
MVHTRIHSIDGESSFDLAQFLACAGVGRRIDHCDPKDALFSQGGLGQFCFLSPGAGQFNFAIHPAMFASKILEK